MFDNFIIVNMDCGYDVIVLDLVVIVLYVLVCFDLVVIDGLVGCFMFKV